jgi:DNA-3-methyladenine glycosylase
MRDGAAEAEVVETLRAGRAFYATDPERMARLLLGQRLVRVLDDGTRLGGVIVETEAYLGVRDRAAHSYGGRRTARVEPMYGPPGTAYVYFTYGMHHCFNVVCGRPGEPVAVLVRALEPTEGLEWMRQHRGLSATAPTTSLCRGPARLCEALAIDRQLTGLDLTLDRRLFIEPLRARPMESHRLLNTPRIGVGYAGPWARRRLRWLVRESRFASASRASTLNVREVVARR